MLREGRLRELRDLVDLDNLELEQEILETLKNGKQKDKDLYNKQSMSRGSNRYYTS